jgi:DNA end-binding protein Ku
VDLLAALKKSVDKAKASRGEVPAKTEEKKPAKKASAKKSTAKKAAKKAS